MGSCTDENLDKKNEDKIDKQSKKNSERTLSDEVRMWFSFTVIVYGVFFALNLLSIDFLKEELPELQVYHHSRWKLITIWFNLAILAYHFASSYCEWMLKRGKSNNIVIFLDKVRHPLFTGIIFPSTLFSDVFFWSAYFHDKTLLYPVAVEKHVGLFKQNLMHTVSLIIVVIDHLITDRKFPKNYWITLGLCMGWVWAYHVVAVYSILNGCWIYPFLERIGWPKGVVLYGALNTFGHLCFYTSQWKLAGLLVKPLNNKIKNL